MIDYEFIKELEGTRLNAYVPKDSKGNIIGQSGVTIGSGIDLGNFGDFSRLGISKSLIDKLEPYVGLRRDLAEQMLIDIPLKLSDKEVSQLNEAVIRYFADTIKGKYEKESKGKWESLPDTVQTVVASVLYQYGSTSRVPKFWSYAINRDWDSMISELRNFGDSYPTRRNKEADLLETAL